MVIILMGVSGSGKTTVGELLAEDLGWVFYDADDFHPQSNIDKMSHGIPLTDADRSAWLAILHKMIASLLEKGQSAVLACSALKRSYREELGADRPNVKLVFLKGSFELIKQRMMLRKEHFMKVGMLPSQFEDLEEPTPEEALIVSIDQTPEAIVKDIEMAVQVHPVEK